VRNVALVTDDAGLIDPIHDTQLRHVVHCMPYKYKFALDALVAGADIDLNQQLL
jgi:hypothetical protein